MPYDSSFSLCDLKSLTRSPNNALAVAQGDSQMSQFRDLGQRTRLCVRPKPASIPATRIGAPIPSTTGTPSCSCRKSGLMCTGHWVMPIGIMTSAPLGDKFFSLGKKVFHDLLTVSRDVWQIKTADAETDNFILHAVTPYDGAVKGEQFLVVYDEAEPFAEQRCYVQRRLHRSNYRNVNGRLSTIDAEVEHAQRHDRIVAFFLRLLITLNVSGCYELNLGGRDSVEIR